MELTFDYNTAIGAEQPFFRCVMPEGVDFDQVAYKTIAYMSPDFLMPVQMLNFNRKLEFHYAISEPYVGMSEYVSEWQADAFLSFMSKCLSVLLESDNYFLSPLNFCIDMRYIFIEKLNHSIKFLYVPASEPLNDEKSLVNKLTQIIKSTKIIKGAAVKGLFFELLSDDCTLREFGAIVNEVMAEICPDSTAAPAPAAVFTPVPTPTPATVDVVTTVISAVPVVHPIQPEPFVHSTVVNPYNFELSANQPPVNPVAVSAAIPGVPRPHSVVSDNSSTELLITKQKPAHPPVYDYEARNDSKTELMIRRPALVQAETNGSEITEKMLAASSATELMQIDSTATELLDVGMRVCKTYLQYIGNKKGLPQRIDVETVKNIFTIGRFDGIKPNKQNNFEFQHNDMTKAVSRMHARIQINKGVYEIVDLSSSHGTYLNAIKVTPNVPYPLKSGDKISFSKSGLDYSFINEG